MQTRLGKISTRLTTVQQKPSCGVHTETTRRSNEVVDDRWTSCLYSFIPNFTRINPKGGKNNCLGLGRLT